MRKGRLIRQIEKFTSRTLFVRLMRDFLVTEKIRKLGDREHVYFKDYLNFIEQALLNSSITPTEVFAEPYLKKEHKKEKDFIKKWVSRIKKKPIIPLNEWAFELTNELNKVHTVPSAASTLAILPDGNILSGICSFDFNGAICEGEIVLRNPSLQPIKVMVHEPASALAILPDGNILSSTCCFDDAGVVRSGNIVLRDASGQYIRTLVEEPASALAIMPDGKILSSTCVFDLDGDIKAGEIVLRDSSGQRIKTIDEPASALAILPDGYILSGFYSFDLEGEIVDAEISLRDPSGEYIDIIEFEAASALAILTDGKIISSVCSFDRDGSICEGEFNFYELKLFKHREWNISWKQRINELLIDNATRSCLQFHKGSKEYTNFIALLPEDILRIIYSYVFPFPNMITEQIINPNCFLHRRENHVRQILTANLFANKICGIKFFEQKPEKPETSEKPENPEKSEKSDIKSKEENRQRKHKCRIM